MAETGDGRTRKQKRTMKQLHADLVSLGYDGSYDRVVAFARNWRDDHRSEPQMSGRGTFVPLSFALGEAFQFDWSEDWAIIGGVRTKLQVAHFKLSYSRAFLVRVQTPGRPHVGSRPSYAMFERPALRSPFWPDVDASCGCLVRLFSA